MSYIYLITNKINGKQYVGKTENTIDKRWKEHKQDYKKERCEKRPLYDAMQKYGIDNFEIKELEYLEKGGKLLSEREKYWIQKLNTYGHNGYNATKGGDGTSIYDHNKIIELYKNSEYNMKEVAHILGCSVDTVQNVLNFNNIAKKDNAKVRRGKTACKPVQQFDLQGNYIQTFSSLAEAGRYIMKEYNISNSGSFKRISECCLGKLKTAYKFKWKYIE